VFSQQFLISVLAKRTGKCVFATLEGNESLLVLGYFWRKDGRVTKFSGG